jgi:hypothetical protein
MTSTLTWRHADNVHHLTLAGSKQCQINRAMNAVTLQLTTKIQNTKNWISLLQSPGDIQVRIRRLYHGHDARWTLYFPPLLFYSIYVFPTVLAVCILGTPTSYTLFVSTPLSHPIGCHHITRFATRRTCQYLCYRLSFLSESSPVRMGPIRCPETSVNN